MTRGEWICPTCGALAVIELRPSAGAHVILYPALYCQTCPSDLGEPYRVPMVLMEKTTTH